MWQMYCISYHGHRLGVARTFDLIHARHSNPTKTPIHCTGFDALVLQVATKSVDLFQHEVNVLLSLSLIGDDGSEEVGNAAKRLVAHHHAPLLHHAALDDGGALAQLILPVMIFLLIAQSLRHIPEADIGALWLWCDQVELLAHLLHLLHLVMSQLHQSVNLTLKTFHPPRTPLKPKLEDVVVTTTLDHLVPGVVAAVVAFVRLEEIVRRHLVATDQQTLFLEVEC